MGAGVGDNNVGVGDRVGVGELRRVVCLLLQAGMSTVAAPFGASTAPQADLEGIMDEERLRSMVSHPPPP